MCKTTELMWSPFEGPHAMLHSTGSELSIWNSKIYLDGLITSMHSVYGQFPFDSIYWIVSIGYSHRFDPVDGGRFCSCYADFN